MPGETDSIIVDELPWDGRFVKRAPNTAHTVAEITAAPPHTFLDWAADNAEKFQA